MRSCGFMRRHVKDDSFGRLGRSERVERSFQDGERDGTPRTRSPSQLIAVSMLTDRVI
jgi:hypothetical protein